VAGAAVIAQALPHGRRGPRTLRRGAAMGRGAGRRATDGAGGSPPGRVIGGLRSRTASVRDRPPASPVPSSYGARSAAQGAVPEH
jgi:hypothetical protein